MQWRVISRIDEQDGIRVLRYLKADPASDMSCVACHNAYEKRPDILARRTAEGITPGKQWKQNELLGALYVTVPLDKAEREHARLLELCRARRKHEAVVLLKQHIEAAGQSIRQILASGHHQ